MLLPTGRVLIAGGDNAAAELYDPATDSWSPAGRMSAPTGASSFAVLLPTEVLVGGSATTTAEIYNGNGADPSWRPVLFAPAVLPPNTAMNLQGTRLRGVSEASSGLTNTSPTDFPFLLLQSLDNGQQWVLWSHDWGAGAVQFTTPDAGPGAYLLFTIVNAIPGGSVMMVPGPAGLFDAGRPDAGGAPDAGTGADGGNPADAGTGDAGPTDAGGTVLDAGTADAGGAVPDAGTTPDAEIKEP